MLEYTYAGPKQTPLHFTNPPAVAVSRSGGEVSSAGPACHPAPRTLSSRAVLLLPRSAGSPFFDSLLSTARPSAVAGLRRPGSNQWRRGRLSFLLLTDNLRTRNKIASSVGRMSSDGGRWPLRCAMAHKRRSSVNSLVLGLPS